MKGKKILGVILQTPLALLNIATFGVGIYAAIGNVPGFYISWGTPIIIGSLIASYIIGLSLVSSANKQDELATEYVEVAEEVPGEYPEPQSY